MFDKTEYSSYISEKRKLVVYVPWLSLISFVFVLAGTIAWAVGASVALDNTSRLLSELKVQVQSYMHLAQQLSVVGVSICCLMASVMLLLSCCRSCTERAVDIRGVATRGTPYWMGVSASFTVIWWIVMFLLMFVFFVSCVWYGATYATTGVLSLSVKHASKAIAAAKQLQSDAHAAVNNALAGVGSGLDPAAADVNKTWDQQGPEASSLAPPSPSLVDSQNRTDCPSSCLNLQLLEYFLEEVVCICVPTTLTSALAYSKKAHQALGSVVAGSVLLWVGASFLLMTAAADFAKAKRERTLLLRVQRRYEAAASAEAAAAAGTTGAGASATTPQGGVSSREATDRTTLKTIEFSNPLVAMTVDAEAGSPAWSQARNASGMLQVGEGGDSGGSVAAPSAQPYGYIAGSAGGGVGYADAEADDIPLLAAHHSATGGSGGRWPAGHQAAAVPYPPPLPPGAAGGDLYGGGSGTVQR